MQGIRIMTIVRLAVSICLCASFFAGCGSGVISVGGPIWIIRTGNTDGGENERFLSFPTPRTSHPPGYVFRTSKVSAGDVWVTTLIDSGLIEETSEFLPETSFEVRSDYLAGLVGLGDLGGSKQDKLKVKLKFENCVREAASEDDLSKAISKSKINFKPDEKYYIIQSAIKARKVTVEFYSYKSLNVAIRAQLDSLSAAGRLSKSSAETVVISREFEVPHRVCYKPLRINASGLLSDGSREVILTVVDEGIVVH